MIMATILVALVATSTVRSIPAQAASGATGLGLSVVVEDRQGGQHLCDGTWLEQSQSGSWFVSVRKFVSCLQSQASVPMTYEWRGGHWMFVTRRVDEVSTYQLEAMPIAKDGNNDYRWRQNFYENWKTFGGGPPTAYESDNGGANMMSLYDFTSSFDMFWEVDWTNNRVVVSPWKQFVLRDWDRKFIQNRLRSYRDGSRKYLLEPENGIWDLSPSAWMQGNNYAASVNQIRIRLTNDGQTVMEDSYGLRVRVFVPGSYNTVLWDIYPGSHVVQWAPNKDSARTWRDQVVILSGSTGLSGSAVSIGGAIKAFAVASTEAGALGVVGAIGSMAYSADRAVEVAAINRCIDQSPSDSSAIGFVMTQTNPLVSQTTGCITPYTWVPVGSSGQHY